MPSHTDILHIDSPHVDVHADVGGIVHADGVSAHVDLPIPHADAATHADAPGHVDAHQDGGVLHIDVMPPGGHADAGGIPGVHVDRGGFHVDDTLRPDLPHVDLGTLPSDMAGSLTSLATHLEAFIQQALAGTTTMMTAMLHQQHAMLQAMSNTTHAGLVGMQTSLGLIQQQQMRTLPDLLLQLQTLRDKDASAARERAAQFEQQLSGMESTGRAALEQVRQHLRQRVEQAAPPGPVAAPTTTSAKWALWTDALSGAMQLGVDQWRIDTELQGVRIVGGLAIGPAGVLRGGAAFDDAIRTRLRLAHAPEPLANAVADAVWQAWKTWADHVTIPSLPWYPAFFVWSGIVAPPMPNVPSPLASCVSARLDAMSPGHLASAIKARLGTRGIAGADGGIEAMSRHVAGAFAQWLAGTSVMMALGAGRTTFLLPYVPMGPVAGEVVASRGCLAAGPSFPAAPR